MALLTCEHCWHGIREEKKKYEEKKARAVAINFCCVIPNVFVKNAQQHTNHEVSSEPQPSELLQQQGPKNKQITKKL